MGFNFQKLPVNTLIGADWETFHKVTEGRTVDAGYRAKYRLTKALCRLLSLTNGIENPPLQQMAGRQAHRECSGVHFGPLAQRNNVRTQCTFTRQTIRLQYHLPDGISPHDALWATLVQKDGGHGYSQEAAHRQYGAQSRSATRGRICLGQHDSLHLLQLLVLSSLHSRVQQKVPAL